MNKAIENFEGDIAQLVKSQRILFQSQRTQSYEFRVQQLKKLREIFNTNQDRIIGALGEDLGRHPYESFMAELSLVFSELDLAIKRLKKWMKPKIVFPGLAHVAHCSIKPEALGTILIIGPWNYPFNLIVAPLIGAIAAGNTVVLKPSEYAVKTSKLLHELMSSHFPPDYIAVVEGGVKETTDLLAERFDHIFFTGSSKVGQIIMEKAAKFMTPVTLELGGKSPCFIYGDVDLDLAARKLVWGKFLNCGQTCIAPDYVFIESSRKNIFVDKLRKYIGKLYTENPKSSPFYPRIINAANFDRLVSLIKMDDVVVGGQHERSDLYIEPTVVTATLDDEIMKDEIFGPVLPIIAMDDMSQAIEYVRSKEKPLSLYVFSKNRIIRDRIINETSSGGVLTNDTVLHFAIHRLPFGGVGASGVGRYHGKYSFDTFSHEKSIMRRWINLDFPLREAPYKVPIGFLRFILKYLS